MKTKEEIVANWLPRYTKRKLEDFGEYILLTNFNKYVEIFAERFNVPIVPYIRKPACFWASAEVSTRRTR